MSEYLPHLLSAGLGIAVTVLIAWLGFARRTGAETSRIAELSRRVSILEARAVSRSDLDALTARLEEIRAALRGLKEEMRADLKDLKASIEERRRDLEREARG